MHSIQHTLPALHRHHSKTSTIRQHYYPEGGWGWVICGCVFLIHILTTGMQYSYGVLYTDLVTHTGQHRAVTASWVGSTSLAVSRGVAPLVVAVCRRKSTRLTAVMGGLVMALATLFASFALQLHQVFLSWALVLGVGVGLTREAASLMLGQYFRRRREFVEMIVQTGSGVGITLFSVFFKEAIKSVGWRLGLQAVTGSVFVAFVLGICYRSASLYHPQRRAILHLKNQKKRVKDKSRCDDKPPYFEMQCLRARPLQLLVLACAVFSAGLYAPLFFLILGAEAEGLEDSSLILLQTFLGFAYALGCLAFGLIIVRRSSECLISRHYLCQTALFLLGAISLTLTAVEGYHGYALFMCLYGALMGGAHYALQMLVLEKARARHFPRAWGFMQASSAIPILVGVPITGYINEASPKSGYFFSSACILAGASCLFFLKSYSEPLSSESQSGSFSRATENHLPEDIPRFSGFDKHLDKPETLFSVPLKNGPARTPMGPSCTCGAEPLMVLPKYDVDYRRGPKNLSFASSVDTGGPMCRPELLTCVSEEGLLAPCCPNMDEALSDDCPAQANRYNPLHCSLQRQYFNEDRASFAAYRSQSLPRRPTQHHNHSYHQVATLPRDGSLAQSSRRLGSSSGVSFSEPEGLARLGNSRYHGGSLRSMSPTHLQSFPHHLPKLPSPPLPNMNRECAPLPLERSHPSILRRPLPPPPAQQPQRRYPQLEERTTSV